MLYLKILLNFRILNNNCKFIYLLNINMNDNNKKHKKHKKNKFPVFLLFLMIALILTIGLFFTYKINEPKKIQNFGFRFY